MALGRAALPDCSHVQCIAPDLATTLAPGSFGENNFNAAKRTSACGRSPAQAARFRPSNSMLGSGSTTPQDLRKRRAKPKEESRLASDDGWLTANRSRN